METDRLLLPSKETQKLVEQLWHVVRASGDALVQRADDDTDLRTRVAYLESELESLSALNESQGSTIEQWRTELEGIDELRSEHRSIRAEYEAALLALASKEEELKALQTRVENMEHEASASSVRSEELVALQNELNAVTVRTQNMEGVLQERSRELSTAHLECATLRAEANEAKAVVDQLRASEAQLRQQTEEQNVRLQSALQDRDRELHDVKQAHLIEVQRLNAMIEELQKEREKKDDSEAKYRSLVDEMNLAIAEREQQLRQYELKAQEYDEWKDELKKKSSKAPTLIEGMLRSDVESLSARVAQLEEERTQWTEQASDSADDIIRKEHRKQQLQGIAEKLRNAIDILERSANRASTHEEQSRL